MAVSKRLRFEVLRRDNYTCRYCGKSAPDVEITVDHVIPKALGGSDDPSNLCAACGDCNGGKTSSSPDAPLVADVAEDALRWTRAMQAAAAQMVADLDARNADREQFREWWNNWFYGDKDNSRNFPLPDGWEHTVDQLVAAGLPLRILQDCIDLSIGRERVRIDQKFRYMCGVAWKKLTELQESAKAGAAPGAEGSSSDDWCELSPAETRLKDAARCAMACELLGDLPEDERESELRWAREVAGGDGSGAEEIAAFGVFYGAIRTRDRLTELLARLVKAHPDGRLCLLDTYAELKERMGETFGESDLVFHSARKLCDSIDKAAA